MDLITMCSLNPREYTQGGDIIQDIRLSKFIIISSFNNPNSLLPISRETGVYIGCSNCLNYPMCYGIGKHFIKFVNEKCFTPQ